MRRSMIQLLVLAFAGGSTWLSASAADARTSCVDPAGSGGCFSSIQAAADAARPGTTIEIAAGTYAENVLLGRPTSLVLRGAGAGATVIDGGGAGPVLDLAGERSRLVVSMLTLRNGSAAGSLGAGLHVSPHCKVTIEDAVIEDNAGHGVGVDRKGTLLAARSSIRGNSGRGISGDFRRLELSEVAVDGNGDAGVVAAGGTVDVARSSFSGNTHDGFSAEPSLSGGGSGRPANVVISDSAFLSNGTGGDGRGIAYRGRSTGGGRFTLQGSTIDGNQDSEAGGGLILSWGKIKILTSTISNNSAPFGGGIHVERLGRNDRLSISNSTISGNSATFAGGINLFFGTAREVAISNTTIASNVSATQAGGIAAGGGVTLSATIIADNQAATGPDCLGTIASRGANLVEHLDGCTVSPGVGDLSGVDPALAPLQDNGGTTETHALLGGSPAIGAVDSSKLCPREDQRGVARTVPCDIGAYEAP